MSAPKTTKSFTWHTMQYLMHLGWIGFKSHESQLRYRTTLKNRYVQKERHIHCIFIYLYYAPMYVLTCLVYLYVQVTGNPDVYCACITVIKSNREGGGKLWEDDGYNMYMYALPRNLSVARHTKDRRHRCRHRCLRPLPKDFTKSCAQKTTISSLLGSFVFFLSVLLFSSLRALFFFYFFLIPTRIQFIV